MADASLHLSAADVPGLDGFTALCQQLRGMLDRSWSETDTRVRVIDRVLVLLGYDGMDDIRREVPVLATKEYLDYGLYDASGRALAIVEAKALRQPISDQAAGQCVQYATILGVRWCIITNGVSWAIYDARAPGPLAAKHVATVRLDGGDETLERSWRVLVLFSKGSLVKANPLSQLLIERVVLDELATPGTGAVAALRKAVKDRFGEAVSPQAVVEVLSRLVTGVSSNEPLGAGAEPTEVGITVTDTRPVLPRVRPQGASIAELIASGVLASDASIEGRVRGVPVTARLRDGQFEVHGQPYSSLSAAAAAVVGGAVNGWQFWRYQGTSLAELRRRLPGNTA